MVEQANGEGYSAEKFADPISLGSTYVFIDHDKQKYLFYAYVSKKFGGREGEGQISVVKLLPRKRE